METYTVPEIGREKEPQSHQKGNVSESKKAFQFQHSCYLLKQGVTFENILGFTVGILLHKHDESSVRKELGNLFTLAYNSREFSVAQ
jgi:hypothetical protein